MLLACSMLTVIVYKKDKTISNQSKWENYQHNIWLFRYGKWLRISEIKKKTLLLKNPQTKWTKNPQNVELKIRIPVMAARRVYLRLVVCWSISAWPGPHHGHCIIWQLRTWCARVDLNRYFDQLKAFVYIGKSSLSWFLLQFQNFLLY